MKNVVTRQIEIMENEFENFQFTWDEKKSAENILKGRPSFQEFIDLFVECYESTTQKDSRKNNDEDRKEIILTDRNNKKWKMVFVVRGSLIRIITCHRK